MITLKAARINAGLRIADVHDRVGVSAATMSSWERHVTFPSARQLKKLCEIYGQSIADICIPDELEKEE